MVDETSPDHLRLDVWLDVACVCKTRSAAQRACRGGKISVNGDRGKPHREISPGDLIAITSPGRRKRELLVTRVVERHVPKADARTLYDDVTPPPSPAEAELIDLLRRVGPIPGSRQGMPDRRQRRLRRGLKGRI